jgi:TRAP-type C4-dicarboxylate transport system permease small subunit
MRTYIRLITLLSRAGGFIATLLLAAAVVVVCQMIVMRYFLNASTVWQTEFVIYALVASTYLGSAYVLIRKGHVGVDLLPQALGGKAEQALRLLAAVLSMIFLSILTWSGWQYFHEAWSGGWTTDTVWALPLWIPLLPLPVGMGLLILQYVAEIMKILLGEADNETTTPATSVGVELPDLNNPDLNSNGGLR